MLLGFACFSFHLFFLSYFFFSSLQLLLKLCFCRCTISFCHRHRQCLSRVLFRFGAVFTVWNYVRFYLILNRLFSDLFIYPLLIPTRSIFLEIMLLQIYASTSLKFQFGVFVCVWSCRPVKCTLFRFQPKFIPAAHNWNRISGFLTGQSAERCEN